MKNRYLALVGIGLALFAVACKKMDVRKEITTSNETVTSNASEWKAANNWQAVQSNQSTTYQNRINDPALTSSVISNGLVLAYANNGRTVEQLPFQQSDGGNTYYWYYQVSEGVLTISVQSKNTSKTSFDSNIAYIILTPEKIKELESKGISKGKLIEMNYTEAKQAAGK